MGVTDWGEINQPLGAPALGGAGGWADSVAQALNNSDTTVDARLAALEAAMEALIDDRVAKTGDTMTGTLYAPKFDAADAAGGVVKLTIPEVNAAILKETADGPQVRTFDDASLERLQVATPTADDHAATKGYVDAVGAWQNYTPTLGNCTGTVTGARYARAGDMIVVEVDVTIDTVTGIPEVTMPTDVLGQWQMSVQVTDQAPVRTHHASAGYVTGDVMQMYAWVVVGDAVTVVAMGPTIPFTWASGDVLNLSGYYLAPSS